MCVVYLCVCVFVCLTSCAAILSEKLNIYNDVTRDLCWLCEPKVDCYSSNIFSHGKRPIQYTNDTICKSQSILGVIIIHSTTTAKSCVTLSKLE